MFSTVYPKGGNITALREKKKHGSWGARHPEAINQKCYKVLTGKPTKESLMENKVVVGLHQSARIMNSYLASLLCPQTFIF